MTATDQFDSFVEDFLGEKAERPLIIVGASKVEDLLFLILSKFLLAKGSGKDDLLEGDRPLATFSSRIKLTYRLGIIDKNLSEILEQLRAIRNLSAHSIKFDVKSSPMKERLSTLRKEVYVRKSFALTKKRYFNNVTETPIQELQCLLITLCVVLQAILEKTTRTVGIEETLKIAKR